VGFAEVMLGFGSFGPKAAETSVLLADLSFAGPGAHLFGQLARAVQRGPDRVDVREAAAHHERPGQSDQGSRGRHVQAA
jgi:hypothetical protein